VTVVVFVHANRVICVMTGTSVTTTDNCTATSMSTLGTEASAEVGGCQAFIQRKVRNVRNERICPRVLAVCCVLAAGSTFLALAAAVCMILHTFLCYIAYTLRALLWVETTF